MSGRGRGRGALSHWETKKAASDSAGRASPGDKHRRTVGESRARKNIVVTHIVDIDHFWARIGTTQEMEKFDKYMMALNTWCEEQPPMKLSPGELPVIGRLECVRQAQSGLWRRAQITKQMDSTIDVLYLDHGNTERVPLTAICNPTPNNIGAYPQQAKRFTLGGIESVDGTWCSDSVKLFSDIAFSGNKLEAEIAEDTGDMKMFFMDDRKGRTSVADILIQEGFAVEIEVDPNTNTKLSSRSKLDDEAETSELEKLEALLSPVGFSRPVKSPSPQAQDTQAANYFADGARVPKCASENGKDGKTCVPRAGSSGIARADSSNDWRAECAPHVRAGAHVPASRGQRFKPHLASPEDFLGSAAASTRTPAHAEGLPRPTNSNQGDFYFRKVETAEYPNRGFRMERAGAVQAWRVPPNDIGRGRPFGIQWARDVESPQHPSQPELLKTQSLSENTEDKNQKAELDWQVWKYQRAAKRMLDRMTTESAGSLGSELETLVADSRLSRDYQGVSEVLLLLQMIVDRVVDTAGFEDLGVQACMSLQDLGIPGLASDLTKVLTGSRNSLTGQLGFNNWQKKCQRFCLFLGKLYRVICASGDDSLKVALDGLISRTVQHWTDLDQNDGEAENQMSAVCLRYLLPVIGPMWDQAESSPINGCFERIREHVLSTCLSVDVKSEFLDVLLLRAAGWTQGDNHVESEEEGETSENADEGDVVIESDDNRTPSETAKEERDPEAERVQDCDDYSEVKTMLSKLKLQHLFVKFEENCIRDSLLTADKEELKKTLQEAGFPPGVILEVRMYVDKVALLTEESMQTVNPFGDKSGSHGLAWESQFGKPNQEPQSSRAEGKPVESQEAHYTATTYQPRHNSWPDGVNTESNESILPGKGTLSVGNSNLTQTATEFEEIPPKTVGVSKSKSFDGDSNLAGQALSSRMLRGFRLQNDEDSDTLMPYEDLQQLQDSLSSSTNNRKDAKGNRGFALNPREAPKIYRDSSRNARESSRGVRDVATTGRRAPFEEDTRKWRTNRGHGVGSRAPSRPPRNVSKGRGLFDQTYDKPYRAFGPGRGAGPRRNPRGHSPPRPSGAGGFSALE